MKLVTGKVVAGRIEIEGERLKEGSTVTVLAQEDDERFELTAEQEAELARRILASEQAVMVRRDTRAKDFVPFAQVVAKASRSSTRCRRTLVRVAGVRGEQRRHHAE